MRILLRVVGFLVSAGLLHAQEPVNLIAREKPGAGWTFNNGQEFPGATGSVSGDPTAERDGHGSLKLLGDFTKGGKYVVAGCKIEKIDIGEISIWVRSPDTSQLTLRINDTSGQTHQLDLKMEPQPGWQHLVLPLEKFFAKRGQSDAVTSIGRYESWGGAKDGKWHGPATALYVLATEHGEGKVRTVWFNEVTITPPTGGRTVAYLSDFRPASALAEWQVTKGVSVDGQAGYHGKPALLLQRALENLVQPIAATSPAFNVRGGVWELTAACQAQLNSADSSYNGVVTLECFDSFGKVIERFTVADLFGAKPWNSYRQTVQMPADAYTARFQIQLNKTWGEFRVGDLSASRVSPSDQGSSSQVLPVVFSTAQLGNLLLPTDSRVVRMVADLRRRQWRSTFLSKKEVAWDVRDYWGAEQGKPVTAKLSSGDLGGGEIWGPVADLDMSSLSLEVGRYYELHVSMAGEEGKEPYHASTSFAILPEAETKKYKPEEVPFTSRNWDNRITEYVKLTDRLGIRVCGVWGGWEAKPPYTPQAPQLDLVKQLGMGWLTGTPIAQMELGKADYDETALRKGVRNLIEKYGAVRPFAINLGNEPHGKGERVLKNVAAYRAVYEEVKKTDPTITVVATSVEPNEEYFQAGYGQWCDAFDFHIYETPEAVRRTIGEYRELMKKYHCEKPIWSTELGLNSQGQTRLAVAQSLTKKFATFFAAGGTSASWFGLLYPDPDGKSSGSSGDSHNVFDCRFHHYAPRLDAIAYYNAVNAIGIKKFVEEKTYPNGVHAFLFRDRDGRSLQILWAEKGSHDVGVPLAGVQDVQVIRIDGAHRALHAAGSDLTLTVNDDPLLLLYQGGGSLAAELGAPAASLEPLPKSLLRMTPVSLKVASKTFVGDGLGLVAPAFWAVQKDGMRFTATPTAGSAVREGDFTVTLTDAQGRRRGELYARAPLE